MVALIVRLFEAARVAERAETIRKFADPNPAQMCIDFFNGHVIISRTHYVDLSLMRQIQRKDNSRWRAVKRVYLPNDEVKQHSENPFELFGPSSPECDEWQDVLHSGSL